MKQRRRNSTDLLSQVIRFHSDSFELYACILLIRFEIITMANFSGDLSL